MAFHLMMPEKYGEFHNALLGGPGRATEATAIKVALSLGADEAKLREKMKNPSDPRGVRKTYDLANKLAITGTPSYVVGNEVVFGALGQDVLAEKIAQARTATSRAADLPRQAASPSLLWTAKRTPLRSFRGGLCQL